MIEAVKINRGRTVAIIVFLFGVFFYSDSVRQKQARTDFNNLVFETDKSLVKFGLVDERYVNEKETGDNYAKAWVQLDTELTVIREKAGRLEIPRSAREEYYLYKSGLEQTSTAVDKVVEYLKSSGDNPQIFLDHRDQFRTGLVMMKQVRDRLKLYPEEDKSQSI